MNWIKESWLRFERVIPPGEELVVELPSSVYHAVRWSPKYLDFDPTTRGPWSDRPFSIAQVWVGDQVQRIGPPVLVERPSLEPRWPVDWPMATRESPLRFQIRNPSRAEPARFLVKVGCVVSPGSEAR